MRNLFRNKTVARRESAGLFRLFVEMFLHFLFGQLDFTEQLPGGYTQQAAAQAGNLHQRVGRSDAHIVIAADPGSQRFHVGIGCFTREKSAHLPLGSGDVKLLDRFAALKGDTCLIEVKTLAGLSESVEYMKQKNLMK